jgi:hypothetical protein
LKTGDEASKVLAGVEGERERRHAAKRTLIIKAVRDSTQRTPGCTMRGCSAVDQRRADLEWEMVIFGG